MVFESRVKNKKFRISNSQIVEKSEISENPLRRQFEDQ